ncbi:MAG: phytanoyl-CoA dioxygenase family protein [bacterium]
MKIQDKVLNHFREHGWAVLEGLLDGELVARVRRALVAAAEASEAQGISTRLEDLDPGGRNVRVFNLIAHDPVFVDLVAHPEVVPYVETLLDNDMMISNFTANIGLPGSGSMNAHCDQSTIMPEPWPKLFAMNAIWCLDDTDAGNGATHYLPGSHRFHQFSDVPEDPRKGMLPFEAKAGSVILMDGRVWHTSGVNRSTDRERALLFAFYSRSFLRLQANWWQVLSRETRRSLSPQMKAWLGLKSGNSAYGSYLTG